MKKIKKVRYSLFISLILTISNIRQSMGTVVPMYGIEEPYYEIEEETMFEKVVETLHDVSQKMAIPVILLIGVIIYSAKSKKSLKHKLSVLMIIALIYMFIRIGIYYLYTYVI